MADLLLELLSEEIPARMQLAAIEQLKTKLLAGLKDARLEHGDVAVFSTPRRLAIRVAGLPEKQPDMSVERKGPKVNAPEKAIEGFCKSVGLSKDALEVRTVGKDDVYFAASEQQGLSTLYALPEIIQPIITGFHWLKSMRWSDYNGHWVRPLRSIMCLLDEQIVTVAWEHIRAGNITQGHRFMADGEVMIERPYEYEDTLGIHHVMANREARKALILEQSEKLAASEGLRLKQDHGLLEEVTGLVEHPVAVMGEFDADYLNLPPEVLVLEMRYHQKYFALENADRSLANRFITIANIAAVDGGASIRKGNERVLRARLDDGVFYWDQDRKKTLDAWADGLQSMIFHKALGSVADKVGRIVPLATFLAVFVPHSNLTHVERAATLCKADLTTGMVGEFPELQGVMGRYYAVAQGEEQDVADAIRDHYKPAGASDDVPEQAAAIAVALADKLDSLVSLFAVGEAPTGSKDPFALRRAALGIIRIIREHELRIPLAGAIKKALGTVKADVKDGIESEVLRFFMDRLKVALKDDALRHDVIDAVCADGDDDIVRLVARVKALQSFLASDDGVNIMAASKRASNILRKEEKQDAQVYDGHYKRGQCVQDEEQELADALQAAKPLVDKALKHEAYEEAMEAIAALRTPLDAFFDNVTVNADEAGLRENRLHILASVRAMLQRIADFSVLEG